MTDREARPDKQDVARALLLRGSVFVYMDPRAEGVRVPPWLARQPQLVLQVGLDLPVPIPDLRVDDAGVYGTLSFSRQPFTCHVPWSAVFALVGDDGMGMVWEEDLPSEIAAEVEAGYRRESAAAEGPKLRAIVGGRADETPAREAIATERDAEPEAPIEAAREEREPSGSEPPEDGGRGGRPPWLRVIK